MRATSSIRSSSVFTSFCARKEGTSTLNVSLLVPSVSLNCRRVKISLISFLLISTPIFEAVLFTERVIVRGFSSNLCMSVIGPARLAPGLTSRMSSIALNIAVSARFGSSCFSNLWTASVLRPRAVDVRRTLAPLKFADSMIMSVVSFLIPEPSPPMMPAIAIGVSWSAIMSISSVNLYVFSSIALIFSPLFAVRTTMPFLIRLRSNAWSGWPSSDDM